MGKLWVLLRSGNGESGREAVAERRMWMEGSQLLSTGRLGRD